MLRQLLLHPLWQWHHVFLPYLQSAEAYQSLLRAGLETDEGELSILQSEIVKLEKKRDLAANTRISKSTLKNLLQQYINIYDSLSQEEKIRINQLLFIEITSFFHKDDEDGKIIIKIRGDGQLEKGWKSIKNAYLETQVRTSERLGSASRTRTCNPSVNSRMLHH